MIYFRYLYSYSLDNIEEQQLDKLSQRNHRETRGETHIYTKITSEMERKQIYVTFTSIHKSKDVCQNSHRITGTIYRRVV